MRTRDAVSCGIPGSLPLLLTTPSVWANGDGHQGMWEGMWEHMGGGYGPWFMAIGILVVVGLGVLAYYLWLGFGRPARSRPQVGKAMEIAGERLARGEIGPEEYDRLISRLGQSP